MCKLELLRTSVARNIPFEVLVQRILMSADLCSWVGRQNVQPLRNRGGRADSTIRQTRRSAPQEVQKIELLLRRTER